MRSSRRAAPIRFAAIAAAAALLTGAGTALAVERDAPPPEVAITGSPPAKVKIARAGTATLTWEFAADRPGTFNCKLTGRGLIAPCTSPVTLAGVGRGRYRFTVYAIDVLTSRDASRARDEVRVVRRRR
jgi:hypothetical protein